VDQGLTDDLQLQSDVATNKRAKVNADARAKIGRGLIDDNGGPELFQTGAASCSAFGYTVYKSWLGDEKGTREGEDIPWHIEMLENVANYWAIWSSDSFRKRDGDVYMYQISEQNALDEYGQYLEDGETFATSSLGLPLGDPNPVAQTQEEGTRPMVTVMEFTGKLPGYKFVVDTKNPEESTLEPVADSDRGTETRGNLLVVGDKTIRIEGRPDYIPRYYLIPNRRVQRRPWGFPDVTPTCIDLNLTYIARMSDWVVITNRALFQKYLGKGYEAASIPRFEPRKIQVMPADEDQSIEEIPQNTEYGQEFNTLITEIKENFVRSGGISQVLFDNPQLDANSNQALMTSMKGMIDSVERKQKIWGHECRAMLEDALRTSAKHYKEIAQFVPDGEDWSFKIVWPSVMRSDDPATIAMRINQYNTGASSVETFMEETGTEDPSQELDRIRDEMQDPLTAAIRGQRLPMLAEQTINPAPDPSTVPPDVKHSVTWAASLTPEQEANLAFTLPNVQTGPYGASMGAQGLLGEHATEALADEGTLTNSKSEDSYGTPTDYDENGDPIDPSQVAPTGTAAPGNNTPAEKTAAKTGKPPKGKGKPNGKKPAPGVNSNGGTSAPAVINGPDNNNPASPGIQSQPGSGATATTPEGAPAQNNQNQGQ
jgi:hypothetical protein